jgi:uncharacterized protein
MRQYSSDVAFTSSVKAIQTEKGSRSNYARMERGGGWETNVTPELQSFLADLDMFYLGTANAQGQPYIQYRGGSPGFLRVFDSKTLGFGDFAGNRQYITLGNISENPKAFIFLMDYTRSRRIKLWGKLRMSAGSTETECRLNRSRNRGHSLSKQLVFKQCVWTFQSAGPFFGARTSPSAEPAAYANTTRFGVGFKKASKILADQSLPALSSLSTDAIAVASLCCQQPSINAIRTAGLRCVRFASCSANRSCIQFRMCCPSRNPS